jgi:hypothetical protein
MYITAITADFKKKTYSITCRDLKKNTHWKRAGDSVYDTTSASQLVYDIVFEGGKQAAQKTKIRLDDAYSLAGYVRVPIKD